MLWIINKLYAMNIFFFFQAEDGIRDYKVTGVQTCALPISERSPLQRDRHTGQLALVRPRDDARRRSEEHTSELQSPCNLVCRLLLEKKNDCRRSVALPRFPSRGFHTFYILLRWILRKYLSH